MFYPNSGDGQVKAEHNVSTMFQTNSTYQMASTAQPTYSQYSGSESGMDTDKYQIKTMCLAKKTVKMPNKEEHGFLLFCGLGARKWCCSIDCDSLTFKQAILNIYPRLRSVIGYNLWTLRNDKKTFEKIPEKVNTPLRMRAYLGTSFTGCMIIVPVSDIVLMEERREHLRQMDIKESKPSIHLHHQVPKVFLQQTDNVGRRSICLICGRIEKTPGCGVFHKIMEEPFPGQKDPSLVIAKKLTDILGFNFEQSRKKLIASTEVCRKCLRTVCDLVKKEEEIKAAREDLVSAFFSTTSKFNKNQTQLGMAEDAVCPEYQHPFHQKSLPLPMAFLNQSKHSHSHGSNGLVKFYIPNWNSNSQGCQGENGTSSDPHSPTERKQSSSYNRAESDCGSDVASSSFLSVSLPAELQCKDYRSTYTDTTNCRVSPHTRDSDTQSYASSICVSTASSVRSKGQVKAYEHEEMRGTGGGGQSGDTHTPHYHRCEDTEYNPRGDKDAGTDYSNNQSPQSQESSNSFASDSMESQAPTRPATPEDDKVKSEEEEAEVERRKPWKKRKRAIESDQESIGSDKSKLRKIEGKGEDSTSSSTSVETVTPSYEHQLDPSSSDPN